MASTGREQIGIGNGPARKKDVLTPVFKSLLAGLPVQHVFLVTACEGCLRACLYEVSQPGWAVKFGLLYQAGLAKTFFLLKIVVVCMRGQAGRLSESPLLRACEIQGAQHQIPLKKDFLVLPRAKVRCQGPQGTARAHGVPFTGALPYVM